MKLLLAIALLVSSASASVIFTLGNHPQPNEQNIPIANSWNASTHDAAGDFITIQSSGGVFNPLGQIVPLTSIWIQRPNYGDFLTFGDLIINPVTQASDNRLWIDVFSYTSGVCSCGSDWFAWGTAGNNNYLTITTTDRTRITNVEILGDFPAYERLQSLQISDIEAPTPEPGTLALLGSGLVGVFGLLRQR